MDKWKWQLTFGSHDAAIHNDGGTVAIIDDTLTAWKDNAKMIVSAPEMAAVNFKGE